MGVSALIAVAGVAISAKGQHDQKKAAERQRREEKKLADIKAARARRKLFREAAIRRGQILAQSGGVSSSREEAATSSIGSQVGGELAFQNASQEVGANIFSAQADAAKGRSTSAIGQSIFSVATSYDKKIDDLFS